MEVNKEVAFNPGLILELWTQLLVSLQNLHNIGYTHNDIKPGNIMIDMASDDRSQIKATLIDFGFSHGFLSSSGKHLNMKDVETF